MSCLNVNNFLLIILITCSGVLKAQTCSNLSTQEWTEVQGYAGSIIPIVLYKLYPAPGNDAERKVRLDSLRNHDYEAYEQVIGSVKSFIANATTEQQTCFYSISNNQVVMEWIGFLRRQDAPESKSLSPEFQKGWGILAELNQGALNPFQKGEAYLLTIRGLLGYTFAKERSGGHVRMFLGPSLYYSNRDVQFLLTSRAEIRLLDLKAPPVSLGAIKFIAEGSTDINGLWVFGPGLGVELPNLGIQVLHQWHTDEVKNHLEVGISYRFLN